MLNEKRFATIRETARLLSISENWLRKMQQEGSLPGVYAGSRYYVNVNLLNELLDDLSRKGATNE